ncbi:MAG TPA: hypothetical protein VGA88_13035 [Burkholderiales bacterium]
MIDLAAIEPLALGLSFARPDSAHAKHTAVEFDAMVWEMLLRHSGLLNSLSVDNQTPLAGEMFLQDIARQLAQQMDLGFGRLLASQAAGETTRG